MADTGLSVRHRSGAESRQAPATYAPAAPLAPRRPGVWQRFRRHRVAVVGALILLVLTAGAVAAPVVAANDPYKVDISARSEEHTSELQSRVDLVCRLLLEKKKERTHNRDLLTHDTQTLLDMYVHLIAAQITRMPRRPSTRGDLQNPQKQLEMLIGARALLR